jgi:hypothetical protein
LCVFLLLRLLVMLQMIQCNCVVSIVFLKSYCETACCIRFQLPQSLDCSNLDLDFSIDFDFWSLQTKRLGQLLQVHNDLMLSCQIFTISLELSINFSKLIHQNRFLTSSILLDYLKWIMPPKSYQLKIYPILLHLVEALKFNNLFILKIQPIVLPPINRF